MINPWMQNKSQGWNTPEAAIGDIWIVYFDPEPEPGYSSGSGIGAGVVSDPEREPGRKA